MTSWLVLPRRAIIYSFLAFTQMCLDWERAYLEILKLCHLFSQIMF